MKTKIASFIAFLFLVGFLFVMIIPSMYSIHSPGQPLRNPNVFEEIGQGKTENVKTMDDYFLRNGQQETGSNNIVTSVVFDYRGFDTLGEGTVLFIAVSSISLLLYQFLKKKKDPVEGPSGFSPEVSRIVSYAAFLLFPIIVVFGAYLVIHGHLSPGGGFQGGAVTASGTALLLVGMLVTRKSYTTRKILGIFESLALVAFIGIGFAGLTTAFLYNFMATPDSFMNIIMPLGTNTGDLTSAGTLPFISLAVGIEVFCGISIILVALYNMTKADKEEEKEVKEES
jgi:multisubunit Na+/H+ antiporter MnhB subunit